MPVFLSHHSSLVPNGFVHSSLIMRNMNREWDEPITRSSRCHRRGRGAAGLRPGRAWASIRACPISAAARASGTPILPIASSGSISTTWPIPSGSPATRSWPGAFTATASTSIAGPCPHPGFALLLPLGRSQARRLFRLHLQRRRPVPEGRLCRGADPRVPRVDPPPAMRGRLPGAGLAGRRPGRSRWTRRRCAPGRRCRLARSAGGWRAPTC